MTGDPEGCYGCYMDMLGFERSHETYFSDSRTGRKFCHECASALIQWELDGRPDPEDHPYLDWIEE